MAGWYRNIARTKRAQDQDQEKRTHRLRGVQGYQAMCVIPFPQEKVNRENKILQTQTEIILHPAMEDEESRIRVLRAMSADRLAKALEQWSAAQWEAPVV